MFWGKHRARLFLGLLILSIVCLQIPSVRATSISVQYSTNDGIELPNDVNVLYANGTWDGTLTGGSWETNGLTLANTNYVTFSNTNFAIPSTWTAFLWYKPTSTGAQNWLKDGTTTDPAFMFTTSGSLIKALWEFGGDNAYAISSSAYSANKLYFIVVVFNGAYFHIYLNGTKLALGTNTTGTGGRIQGSSNIILGAASSGMVGTVYSTGILFNVIYSQSDVTAAFNEGIKGPTPLTASNFIYAKMDEGEGTKVCCYNNIATFSTQSTPQTLAISQTASAVNSSLITFNPTITVYPDIWVLTNSTNVRINTTGLQTLLFDHYVYLNFLVSPALSGSLNVTDGYYKTLTSYGILASNSLGYYFKGWYYDGAMSSSENPTSFTPLDNGTLTGVFSSTSTSAYSSVETSEPTLFLYLGLIGLFATLLLGWKLHPFFFVVGIGFGVYLFFMDWDTIITFANATGIYQTTETFRPMNWWYALIAGLMAMQSLVFMLQVVDRT